MEIANCSVIYTNKHNLIYEEKLNRNVIDNKSLIF